jgi:general secretion pathway protein D
MNKSYRSLCFLLALAIIAAVIASPAAAARTYNIDFNDVDIRKMIETVSEITGKNFLVDDRVQGRVTVIGPKSLTSAEVYQVFLSMLQVKGYTVVPAGKINKIVPVANITSHGLNMKVGRSEAASNMDRYVTQIIPIEYSGAEEIKNLLAPLLPKTDSITAYAPTNLLIVTTTESVLSNLSRIISVVDVEGAREEMRIIQVRNAPVSDLAAKINEVLESQSRSLAAVQRAVRGQQQAQSTANSKVRIIADERTNSIIAIADVQNLERVEELVTRLDMPVEEGAGRIQVYYLQHSDAAEMASILMGVPIQESLPAPEIQPGKQSVSTLPRPNQLRKDIGIVADTATNALVITATPEEYQAIKGVIEKLDIPRDQVLVEVLIAEVQFSKTLELGVEWRIADDYKGDAAVFAGSGFGDFDQLSVSFPATPSGLTVGAIGKTITFGDIEFPSLGALIRALQSDSDVNILSTPTLVTTDNREAEIVVGQTVPFQTSQKFDSNNQPVFTFDYRDVGLTLRMTPHINSNGFVQMDIFSKLEALVASTVGTSQELAPTTLKRQADTSVVVKDGHTVVIGGMIRDDKIETESSVPLLGKLPLLGPLFRSRVATEEKTNLLIFLTPHIITSSVQLQEMARERSINLPPVPEEVMERLNLGTETPEEE